MQGISGKVAIATGSGQGIGHAIATRLAEEGAAVAINDVDAGTKAGVAFFASEDADFITGQVLILSGGVFTTGVL